MQWFCNPKLSSKLVYSFLPIIGLTVALGIFTIVKLSSISETADNISNKQLPSLLALTKIMDRFSTFRRGELALTLSTRPEDIARYLKRNRDTLEILAKDQAAFERLIDNEAERRIYAEVAASMQEYFAQYAQVSRLSLENRDTEAVAILFGASSRSFYQALRGLQALVEDQTRRTTGQSQLMSVRTSTCRSWIFIAMVFCVVIGLLEVLLVSNLIGAPLSELASQAERYTAGDRGAGSDWDYRGEVGILESPFSLMAGGPQAAGQGMAGSPQARSASARLLSSPEPRRGRGAPGDAGGAGTGR